MVQQPNNYLPNKIEAIWSSNQIITYKIIKRLYCKQGLWNRYSNPLLNLWYSTSDSSIYDTIDSNNQIITYKIENKLYS